MVTADDPETDINTSSVVISEPQNCFVNSTKMQKPNCAVSEGGGQVTHEEACGRGHTSGGVHPGAKSSPSLDRTLMIRPPCERGT